MITLYAFRRIFPEGVGETKDLRAQWALEETGLPYRVHGLDHTAGETQTEACRQLSPFGQVPVIDDDGRPGGAPAPGQIVSGWAGASWKRPSRPLT